MTSVSELDRISAAEAFYSFTFMLAVIGAVLRVIAEMQNNGLNTFSVLAAVLVVLVLMLGRMYVILHVLDSTHAENGHGRKRPVRAAEQAASQTTLHALAWNMVDMTTSLNPLWGAIERVIRLGLLAVVLSFFKPFFQLELLLSRLVFNVQVASFNLAAWLQNLNLAPPGSLYANELPRELLNETMIVAAVFILCAVLFLLWDILVVVIRGAKVTAGAIADYCRPSLARTIPVVKSWRAGLDAKSKTMLAALWRGVARILLNALIYSTSRKFAERFLLFALGWALAVLGLLPAETIYLALVLLLGAYMWATLGQSLRGTLIASAKVFGAIILFILGPIIRRSRPVAQGQSPA